MTKILVVEDMDSLREEIIETLTYEGFEVIGAENGAVGVELALKHLPNLIICDVMMPELNGYETLTTLRREPSTATIPFIFLTAKADKVDMRQGMQLGADDYLTKPFTIEELL
ncbi:MAG: response regulator, partial [Pseudanabaena sp. CRU_2_10]|nr:response regulator [Pseudanabaena sp. CRU_2_10]